PKGRHGDRLDPTGLQASLPDSASNHTPTIGVAPPISATLGVNIAVNRANPTGRESTRAARRRTTGASQGLGVRRRWRVRAGSAPAPLLLEELERHLG
ncbi:MAG: hypothetical protein ACKO2D_08845, partial [Chloroflexota bacterium]